jgi:phenylpropionate dioxygenase-like ring-hydroxylating dioxygenase large terminal subunit
VCAQGGNENAARACVAAYPAVVKQGLLWVKPQPLPNPVTAGADAAL